ncbi:MAG: primosomal replication protein N [Candidatus Accumulibacter sp.]|nr:primosomal replication protein N [Accumulibacter sp.]
MTGTLIERKAQRFTPTGVPVTECTLHHESEQVEAGHSRRIECAIRALALGETSKWIEAAPPGSKLRATGFLASGSRNGGRLKLHLTQIEFIEGNKNGQILQEEG